MRVLVTCKQMQSCIELFEDRFARAGVEVVAPEISRQQFTEDELIDLLVDIDGIIAGDDFLTERVIVSSERLKVIAKWGVGIDGIDVEAAERRGVAVSRTPGVFGDEVADVALGYVLMLRRQLHRLHASVLDGGWLKIEGTSLAGKSLGVVGFGDIGRAVAKRATGFDVEVLVSDPYADSTAIANLGYRSVEIPELLAESDVVVLCCPLTEETEHLIDRAAIDRMREGAHLVNVARGPLVDEGALIEALENGRIAAAALDVFEQEPLPIESGLRSFEQCVFGTHNGSNSTEGVIRASEKAVDNLLRDLDA